MNITDVMNAAKDLPDSSALFIVCLVALGLVWRALGLIARDKDKK